jgi:hypothetical protein
MSTHLTSRTIITAMITVVVTVAIFSIRGGDARPAEAGHGPPEGTILATVNSGIGGVGVGFDGNHLYVPNGFTSSTLSKFQTDGTPAGSVGLVGCQVSSISWDATRSLLWGANGTEIYLIDTTTGACNLEFSLTGTDLPGNCKRAFGCLGLVDGIDYDPGDDSLWYSPDASLRVYHYDVSGCPGPKPACGGLLDFFDVDVAPHNMIPECGFDYSSGLATGIDPNAIYLAADGCDTVFRYDKVSGAKVLSFPVAAQRNEDMECDNVTFAGQHVDAVWVKDLVGPINAFAVPAGTCVSVTLEAPVDIQPQSCPNPLQLGRRGTLPIAFLGTADFDVAQVDPTSLSLEGVAPLRWSLEDVATPFGDDISDPPVATDCTTEGPDGLTDLTLKFDAQEVVAALGAVGRGDVVVVTLTGELLDGTPIEGEDVIRIQ